VEDCPASCRTPYNIDSLVEAFHLVEVMAALIVADGNSVGIPAIEAQYWRATLRHHSVRQELIHVHVMRTGMKSRIEKFPFCNRREMR
jgi:hypothetical protein